MVSVGPADVVIVNAVVVTMDKRRPSAGAVAVRDGWVVAVGTDEEVRSWAGRPTRVLDLGGRVVMPGFHDSHNHMLMTGMAMLRPDLSRAHSVADVLDVILGEVERTPAGSWIETSAGWHESQLYEKRLPTRRELDSVAPAHPVFMRRGGHNAALNSRALEIADIEEDAPDPPGATYVRDPATGELTGHVVGMTTVRSLARLLPPSSSEEQMRALRVASDRYAQCGLTSVIEPGLSLEEMALVEEFAETDELSTRVSMMWRLFGPGENLESALDQLADGGVRRNLTNPWARTLAIKLGVDGGVETGYYREPYLHANDPAHPRGKPLLEPEELTVFCQEAARRGWQVGVHCVGDAAIDMTLDAFEDADVAASIRDLRWTLIHMMYPREDHWERANRLKLAITAQQPLLYALAAGFATYIGPQRTADIEPLAAYLSRCDQPVGGGSDSPVAPYPPLLGIASSVTRSTRAAGVVGPGWAIGIEDALRMYTRGSAWCSFEESVKGMLIPGAYADLVVLSEDPRGVKAEAIADISVLLTMVGGRVVHDQL